MRALWRGVRRRCPRCGQGRLFRGYFTLLPRCPGCGLRFEREEGYWVGAMIVNIAVAELAFGIVLVGGILLWWPDVPWGLLTIAGVAVNAIVPVLFYPWSKTIWMAVDVLLNRMDIRDRDASGNGDAAPRVFDRRTIRP
ncbi:MAG TPA: DUF983 domain-containing protein [Actinomycetota bacterium]|nr:DUF983 domain-containing protein [Actinomycetota bacterium]